MGQYHKKKDVTSKTGGNGKKHPRLYEQISALLLTHKSAEPVLFENTRQFKNKALPDTPCLLFKGTKDQV